MAIQVVRVEDPRLLQRLYAFRYRIYVEQEGMTREADHGRRLLEDDYDRHSAHYAVVLDGDVVASLRATYLADTPDPRDLIEKFGLAPVLERFRLDEIGTTSRFIIDRTLRNGRLIYRLLQLAYADGRNRGVRLNYGDCSPYLLTFYERLGYRRYCDGYNDSAFGYKTQILMVMGDREFFNAVCSPLARLAAEWPDDPEARAWFAAHFPSYTSVESSSFLSEGAFFDLLAKRVSGDPLDRLPLLHGLDRREADRFLANATFVDAPAGALIIRHGDRDNTLYVLLAGTAEVRRADAEGPTLTVLGAGDTLGQIGFVTGAPRIEDVVARTPVQLLVLSAESVKALIRDEPAIGVKTVLNLAKEVARLATTMLTRDVRPPIQPRDWGRARLGRMRSSSDAEIPADDAA